MRINRSRLITAVAAVALALATLAGSAAGAGAASAATTPVDLMGLQERLGHGQAVDHRARLPSGSELQVHHPLGRRLPEHGAAARFGSLLRPDGHRVLRLGQGPLGGRLVPALQLLGLLGLLGVPARLAVLLAPGPGAAAGPPLPRLRLHLKAASSVHNSPEPDGAAPY